MKKMMIMAAACLMAVAAFAAQCAGAFVIHVKELLLLFWLSVFDIIRIKKEEGGICSLW